MSNTTVVIKTIGRDSLKEAVQSAKREGFRTLIISDGFDIGEQAWGGDRFIKLGKHWGYYGGMAANVGAALAETEFITFLDDDDEFAPGAGDMIRNKLTEKPDVDLWVGGVRFNTEITINGPNGESVLCARDLCMNSILGVTPGNVCMPTYRTSIFSKVPFTNSVPPHEQNLTDFHHISACCLSGYKLDWFENLIYLVRPRVGGVNGAGE